MDRTRARIVGNDRRIWRAWMGAAVLVWASSGLVGTLHAATIIVTTTQDGPVGSVAGCSLREAVQAINNQTNGNGCTKTTLSQPYGTNDRIQFAAGVNNIALTLAANPLANFALSIQRPVDIRGRGTGVTIISGGGGDRTLIHNNSRLTLRSLSLVNAGTGLSNGASGSATALVIRASGHQRRAIVNLGQMTLTLVRVTDNPGGGIANGNATPVQSLGGAADAFAASVCPNRDCCNNQCGAGGNSGGSGPLFSVGQGPAGLVVTRSRITGNGPIACAGIVNGGGMVSGSSGITGIGNPLVDLKLEGALTVRQSRVSGNNAGAADGGGICNLSMAAFLKSEISENSAARGAGGLVRPGTQTLGLTARPVTLIADSTISSNVASMAGGGIFAEGFGGSIRLQFTTVTANSAGGNAAQNAGGLVTNPGVAVDATATVVAGNAASAAAAANADCASTTLVGNHNFMPSSSSGTCSMSGTNNLNSGNLGLGPLTGVTPDMRAHIPNATSVLVDSVPTLCGGRDQRNLVRPRDGNGDGSAICDRGAIER